MKSVTKRSFLMIAFTAILTLCVAFPFTTMSTSAAYAAENEASIVSTYTFEESEATDAEFASKDINSGEIKNYNIYDGDIKISEMSIPESRKRLERNSAGFIPNSTVEYSLRSIIGSDERVKVSTADYPYRAICFIRITFPDSAVSIGSAWMYWNDVAITAGHCVYSSDHGGWASSIEVIPGADGSSRPYGTAWSTVIHTSNKWINEHNEEYDYGVIELNTSIGDKTGYFGTHYSFWSLKNKNITVSGYPGEYYRQQWAMSGKVKKNTTRKIYYNIDTTGGQSGCPVYWYDSQYGHQAIAIHAYGGSTENSGTRITSSLFDFFESFRK